MKPIITLGKWKTENGTMAIVAAEDPNADPMHRFVGWIDGRMASWRRDGSFLGENVPNLNNLVAPWVDSVPWDWSTTPSWIHWISKDPNGAWYLWANRPIYDETANEWVSHDPHYVEIPADFAPKWIGLAEQSLTPRPK